MPQLDFSWWTLHLLINWSLWATLFLVLNNWNNTNPLEKSTKNNE